MGKVYKGQTKLTIVATVGQDITGALTKQIKYRDPNGVQGSWDATVDNVSTGVLSYEVAADGSDISSIGWWTFWGYVDFADGRDAPGEPFKEYIYKEGN